MASAQSLLLASSAAFILILTSCSKKPESLAYRIIQRIPHDSQCYTQGLEFQGERLFESGGGYGSSTLREVASGTGIVLRKRRMSEQVFAEGITIFGNELFVLTWRENLAYVLDPDSFRLIRTHSYQGEGWGLTHNETSLIMSNGSSRLHFLDPSSFSTTRTITVMDAGREIENLNELEFVDGSIYANIYMTDRIARIDPSSGEVTGWLDLSPLRKQLPIPNRAEALNGIALMPNRSSLLVTGKFWPRMFEIEIQAER